METRKRISNDSDTWIEFLVPIKDEDTDRIIYHPHVKYKVKDWDADFWYVTRKGYERGFPIKRFPDSYYIIGTIKRPE